jgi:hypothetical protein
MQSWRECAHQLGDKCHRRIHVCAMVPNEVKLNWLNGDRHGAGNQPSNGGARHHACRNAASRSVSYNNSSACKKVGAQW